MHKLLIFVLIFVIGNLFNNRLYTNVKDMTMQENQNLNTVSESKDESKVMPQRAKTQYYSLIFKDNRTVALDSNQKKFLEQVHQLLKKFPNKSIALISYAKGNINQKEDLNIAKKRNKYIIDYLLKNGIEEKRISKKAVAGIIAKQNIELYANSNVIEIMIIEKVILKSDN